VDGHVGGGKGDDFMDGHVGGGKGDDEVSGLAYGWKKSRLFCEWFSY
jgi:hypothetical protein